MKRLVLLFDGTWNTDEATYSTNIVRLREILARSLLEAAEKQGGPGVSGTTVNHIEHLVFYEQGVGTRLLLDRIGGGAFGFGLTTNIRQGYRFLSRYYAPGDEIYVFGFSRGAYTARSLVGFVAAAGLLQASYCTWERENDAWSFYRTPPKDRLPGVLAALSPYVHAASQLRIKCLGVFDTVGALGVPLQLARHFNGLYYAFHDVVLGAITDINLHAIAIDEHRRPFEAAAWTKPKFASYGKERVVEQVWFPGTHSDVGGGYPRHGESTPALEDIALDWMVKRVRAHTGNQLRLDRWRADVGGSEWSYAPQHEPRQRHYRLWHAGIRAINDIPPLLGERESAVGRVLHNDPINHMVHIAALERLGQEVRCDGRTITYLPGNLLAAVPSIWRTYRHPGQRDPLPIVDWDGEPMSPASADCRARALDLIGAARSRLPAHWLELD